MNPQAGDDGFLTRSGVVESETAEVYGASAIYGSTEDKTLGACKLTFRPDGQSVLVAQSGNCPGLGEGVNASGKYRLAKKDEVLVVR